MIKLRYEIRKSSDKRGWEVVHNWEDGTVQIRYFKTKFLAKRYLASHGI